MDKARLVRWVVVGGLLGAAALTVGLVTVFPAQAAGLTNGIRSIAGHGLIGGVVDWWALLADELGISVNELEQAVDAANAAAIDQLVEEGVLTEDEGELARAANALRSTIDHTALVAEALGMSQSDLEAALEDGSSLAELIEEQGLTRAEFAEALQAAREAAIQQAVDDGVITSEQAEQLQSGGGIHRFGPGGRRGPGGFGPGGFGPGFGPGTGWGFGHGVPFRNGTES